MAKQWALSGNAESVDWSDIAESGRAYADNLIGEPGVSKLMHMMADEIDRLRGELRVSVAVNGVHLNEEETSLLVRLADRFGTLAKFWHTPSGLNEQASVECERDFATLRRLIERTAEREPK